MQSAAASRIEDDDIHVATSGYVAWQQDNKVCFIRMEGRGFGGSPIELETRMSVQDSPNSAGCVIDAVRFARVRLDRGWAGPVEVPCAYYMKHPPRQIADAEAYHLGRELAAESKT